MTYHIQPIARTLSPEQILEPITMASPPRVASSDADMSTEPVAIVDRLLYVLGPSPDGVNPVLEALCHANPTAFHLISRALHLLFKSGNCHLQEEMTKNVINLKSLEFFGCEYKHLSAEEKRLLPYALKHPSTRTGHCHLILNEIAYDPHLADVFPAAITDLELVKRTLSRDCFEDEADFERHVLKFEREGEQELTEKVKAYEFIRRMILMVQNSPEPDDSFSTPSIRLMTFNMNFSLYYIPPELWALKHLTLLNLSGGTLRSLSSELVNLEQLTNLDVSDNSLTSLPTELERLSNLISLGIHMNRLVDFPPQVSQLTRLEKLFCGGNPFLSLPAALGQLTNLEYLDLYDNRLTTLPPELKTLTRLISLRADPSQMRAMPEVMVHFRNLEVLHLCFRDLKRPFTDEVREWLSHLITRGCNLGSHEPLSDA